MPGAFGGETLQALVLPRFWTTTNNGGTAATDWDPTLVLAYRVGQAGKRGGDLGQLRAVGCPGPAHLEGAGAAHR